MLYTIKVYSKIKQATAISIYINSYPNGITNVKITYLTNKQMYTPCQYAGMLGSSEVFIPQTNVYGKIVDNVHDVPGKFAY